MKELIDRLIISRFQKDRKRAEKLIRQAFPGFSLKKIRKDAGVKKLKAIFYDEALRKTEGGEDHGRTEDIRS